MPAVRFTVYNVVCCVLCVVRRALCGGVHCVWCSRAPNVFFSPSSSLPQVRPCALLI